MKNSLLVYILVCFLLVSCNANPTLVSGSNSEDTQTVVETSPSAPIMVTVTPSPIPTDTLKPTSADTPTRTPLPSRTPIPTDVPFAIAAHISEEQQRALMKLVVDSGKWDQLALPEQISSRWQGFAAGQLELTQTETSMMVAFLKQWGELTRLLDKSQLNNKAQFQLRAQITPDVQIGDHIALYLIDETSGALRYLMVARDTRANPVGLLLAPIIDGLDQHVSSDGNFIEYYDPNGRTILQADARKLDIENPKEKKLRDRLEALYPSNKYFAYASYPRFFLPLAGIKTGFYGLEESLSAMQIIQLNEAFALYNRPELKDLTSTLFGPQVSVIVTNELGRAVGLTYTGTGVVELDRQDLFGNKYWIAMVLAHEASHVLQGALPDQAVTCTEIEKREVGNHKIPEGFYGWTADELVQAVKDQRIGAYHVSLWMMNRLGIKNLKPFQDIIYTGKVNGQSVVIDCKTSGLR